MLDYYFNYLESHPIHPVGVLMGILFSLLGLFNLLLFSGLLRVSRKTRRKVSDIQKHSPGAKTVLYCSSVIMIAYGLLDSINFINLLIHEIPG